MLLLLPILIIDPLSIKLLFSTYIMIPDISLIFMPIKIFIIVVECRKNDYSNMKGVDYSAGDDYY